MTESEEKKIHDTFIFVSFQENSLAYLIVYI